MKRNTVGHPAPSGGGGDRKTREKSMPALQGKGPVREQQICVTCGFCCDATLFSHAILHPGEKGTLPDKIEQNYRKEDGKEFFLQPCLYFKGDCTIYDCKRAIVCSTYRCQLLKDFAAKKITQSEALEIIRVAVRTRADLMSEYRNISGNIGEINFRQLLSELGKLQQSSTDNGPVTGAYETLIARCNIFEALLIKYFRSAGDFENLIMS